MAKKSTATVARKDLSVQREVVHPDLFVDIEELDIDKAKSLLGWEEEGEDDNWEKDFTLKDSFNKKVRLTNNVINRPLKVAIAQRNASEFLRGKWKCNLENLVIDKFGVIADGQHRLTGFVLAEQQRSIAPHEHGQEPLTFKTSVGYGVDPAEVGDTYDLGQGRSLGDVLYRREPETDKMTPAEQTRFTKMLGECARLVWIRCGGKTVSSAPHFPHSEALTFLEAHPKLRDNLRIIMKLDDGPEGNEKNIKPLVTIKTAASLRYLMCSINGKKAGEFWEAIAEGTSAKDTPVGALRQYLMTTTEGSGMQRDEVIGAIIKAFNLYVAGEKATAKTIKVKKTKDKESGKFKLAEVPRLGGLDIDPDKEVKLNLIQNRILVELMKAGESADPEDREVTQQSLCEELNLTKGVVSKQAMSDKNEYSLYSRELVTVNQYEPEEGTDEEQAKLLKKAFWIGLTDEGRSLMGLDVEETTEEAFEEE